MLFSFAFSPACGRELKRGRLWERVEERGTGMLYLDIGVCNFAMPVEIALPDQRQHGGFQSAETEIKIAAVQHRARQLVDAGATGVGKFCKRRATRITQTQQLGALVECFTRCIVYCFAQQFISPYAIHAHQLGVSARNKEGYEREFGCRVR